VDRGVLAWGVVPDGTEEKQWWSQAAAVKITEVGTRFLAYFVAVPSFFLGNLAIFPHFS
jgi:hypothetical protein